MKKQGCDPAKLTHVIPLALRQHAAFLVYVKKKSLAHTARILYLNLNNLSKYLANYKGAFTDADGSAERATRAWLSLGVAFKVKDVLFFPDDYYNLCGNSFWGNRVLEDGLQATPRRPGIDYGQDGRLHREHQIVA